MAPARMSPVRPVLLLALVTLALRIWDFGNPVIHVDEQYYLLVGARMWEGALPFVDLWDRKPIGLFLLYAAAAAFPGDGIVAYQAMAALAALATALTVWRGGLALGARPAGAMAAAIAYLLWLPILGGRGGQAPVFYNLLPALALMLALSLPALARHRATATIIGRGALASLLCGIAIQIKYTAAIEGAFFGLAFLWFLRRAGARPAALVAAASVWLLAGLLPTLAALATYAAIGPQALAAFWFANFTSILARPGYPLEEVAMRLLGIVAQLSPLIACALLGWRLRDRSAGAPPGFALAYGWLLAAIVGFVSIGTFFDHYALPLVAPLALASATTLGRRPRATVGALGLGLLLFTAERVYVPRDASGAREVARIVGRNSGGECPYVFVGDTITYHLAHACLPTTHAFPNLLVYATEAGATGIDEAAEVRRILAAHPPVIVTSDRQLAIWNRASLAAVKATLAADYRPVFSVARAGWRTVIYLRRDRAFRP